MPSERNKTRGISILVWGYAALGAAGAIYAWYKGAYDAAHSEFSGMPLIVLGLPWSWIWRGFNPRIVADKYNNSILVECMFIAVNVLLLALMVTVINKRIHKDRKN